MRKFVGAFALMLGTSVPAAYAQEAPSAGVKMSMAQCDSLWSQAQAGSSGDLSMDKAQPYVKDFKKADSNGDNMLSQSEWQAGCNQGLIQNNSASMGAGEGGAAQNPPDRTSDRTPGGDASRTPGSTKYGAPGADAAKTEQGTSDRTPEK